MHKRLIIAVITAIFVSACASENGPPPLAVYDTQPQVKLDSAQQWRAISSDISMNIIASLKANDMNSAPLWVPIAAKGSTFSRVLASELRSELARRNASVSTSPNAALDVEVSVDEVQHLPKRTYKPGTLTLLTTGVLSLRQIGMEAADPVAGTAALALATDAIISAYARVETPTTEIVLTTSVLNPQRSAYLMHRTDIYYVDETDLGLYSSSNGRDFAVVGERQ